MTKPTYEDAFAFLEACDIKLYNYQKEMIKLFWDNDKEDTDYSHLFDEVIKPFQTSPKPIEGQLIYLSSASMRNNPFTKMAKEYLKTIKESKND